MLSHEINQKAKNMLTLRKQCYTYIKIKPTICSSVGASQKSYMVRKNLNAQLPILSDMEGVKCQGRWVQAVLATHELTNSRRLGLIINVHGSEVNVLLERRPKMHRVTPPADSCTFRFPSCSA